MAKSGGRKRRPQGCSLRSHRLRRLKPLTPTLSPATHSAIPSMLPCCTSDLKRRDKTLVGNKGYRRFLATPDDDHFVIDRAKAEEDAKFDGIFVLRTNADLSPLETMLCCKHLWMVERAFRTSKSLFATRPIFHKLDETIRGHVSCSFLALVLKKELEDRIATLGHASSWPNVLADLELVDRNGGRTGRQTLSAAHAATPRCKPRPARRRRRPAANRPATRRRLIPPNPAKPPECSAKPIFRRDLCRPLNDLQIRTVEDQFKMGTNASPELNSQRADDETNSERQEWLTLRELAQSPRCRRTRSWPQRTRRPRSSCRRRHVPFGEDRRTEKVLGICNEPWIGLHDRHEGAVPGHALADQAAS